VDSGTVEEHFPEAIYEAVDKHLLSRVEVGEELSTAYVQNTIHRCIEVWNTCVDSFNDTIAQDNLHLLGPLEAGAAPSTPAVGAGAGAGAGAAPSTPAVVAKIQSQMRALLQPVTASLHPLAIKWLGH
jgi:hypothetical protein